MGSILGRGRGGGRDVLWLDPTEILRGHLAELALGAKRREVSPLGLLRFVYRDLIERLRAEGFVPLEHPFDWRRGIFASARALRLRLAATADRDVVLVGHSMGALVVRAALAADSGRVTRAVLLGPPNRGSLAAVQALRGSHPFLARLAFLDPFHSAADLARGVFSTFPGLHALLPEPRGDGAPDFFDPSAWPRLGPRARTPLLRRALDERRKMPGVDERVRIIASSGRPTPIGARVEGDAIVYAASRAGDGTVPLDSAELSGVPTWFATAAHGSLPGEGAVLDAVIDLLRSGTTRALPRERPRVPDALETFREGTETRPARRGGTRQIASEWVAAPGTDDA